MARGETVGGVIVSIILIIVGLILVAYSIILGYNTLVTSGGTFSFLELIILAFGFVIFMVGLALIDEA